jgi:hypothetical protein
MPNALVSWRSRSFAPLAGPATAGSIIGNDNLQAIPRGAMIPCPIAKINEG